MASKRQQAIRRRRIFIICCVAALILCIAAITAIGISVKKALDKKGEEDVSSFVSSTVSVPAEPVQKEESSVPAQSSQAPSSSEMQSAASSAPSEPVQLDENFSNLLLVNGKNPLPADYNYGADLVTIDAKYKNGQLNQINREVWPYMKAMLEAAWADGVNLKVWSPYRSYETQKMLFNNQVQRCINRGFTGVDAENEAATVVARPGTSEHNTGLCADFNMASDAFENTPMFSWMCQNAENYGFILRYPKDKIDITGVIYESWHWRFVGINSAKEINDLGVTLEEYLELKKNGSDGATPA